MKIKRNLSGMFFRVKNKETGEFENIVFEDLSSEQQDFLMKDRDLKWIKSLAKVLAKTISDIGKQFDISVESD